MANKNIQNLAKSATYTVGNKTYSAGTISHSESDKHEQKQNEEQQKKQPQYAGTNRTARPSPLSKGVHTAIGVGASSTIKNNELAQQRIHETSKGFTVNNTYGRTVNNQYGIKTAIEAATRVQGRYTQENDMASQTVGQTVGTGVAAYTVFRGAQAVAPTLVKAGVGAYKIGDTAVKAVKTASSVYGANKMGFVKNGTDLLMQYRLSSQMTGFDKTQFSKRLIHQVQGIQSRVNTMRYGNKAAQQMFIKDIKKSTFCAINYNKKLLWKGAKLSGKGIKMSLKGGALVAAGTAAESEDIGVSAIGNSAIGARTAARAAKLSARSGKMAYNRIKTGVTAGIKTGKNTIGAGKKIHDSAKFIKNNGLRQAWKYGQRSLRNKMYKAGGSALNLTLGALKKVGTKTVLPLLLLVGVILGIASTVTAPVGAVGGLFGQGFTTDDGRKQEETEQEEAAQPTTAPDNVPDADVGLDGGGEIEEKPKALTEDWDIHDYLMQSDKIPAWKMAYAQELSEKYTRYCAKYDVVTICCANDGANIDGSVQSITNVFYSDEEITKIIQPIFNGILLMDYELSPTTKQANKISKGLFDDLFVATEDVTTSGGGTTEDGEPIPSVQTMTITLSMGGLDALLCKHFTKPIAELESKNNKTDEEQDRLVMLKDFYELTLEFIKEVEADYGEIVKGSVGGGGLSLTPEQIAQMMKNLPKDISAERKAVLEKAYSLIGKVKYFWGGKSAAIGWDNRWGTPAKVWAAGSKTSGTTRPFGLDCSGFVDWAFNNAIGVVIGQGGGTNSQLANCKRVTWATAKAGDIVFYPNISHVGIFVGADDNGNPLIIHCSSGKNGVVQTGLVGFTIIARPNAYTD